MSLILSRLFLKKEKAVKIRLTTFTVKQKAYLNGRGEDAEGLSTGDAVGS